MQWPWYAATLGFAAVDWLAVGYGWVRFRKLTKPAVMLALITGFTAAGGWNGDGIWFGLGLIFSLAGDVFLMLPPRFFIAGLGAFLVAHLAYIIGFNQSPVVPAWGFLFPVAGLVIVDALSFRRIRASILTRPQSRWLRFPMFGYMIIISLMLFSSYLCWFRPDWPYPAAALVSFGALLFYISDTTLAFNRFCSPIRGGQLLVIITYHLAQLAIVAGVLFRSARI